MVTSNDLSARLSYLVDGAYKCRVGCKILGIIGQLQNVRRARVLKGCRALDETPFFDILYDAADREVISMERGIDAGYVDVFLKGQSYPDNSTVCVAVEVSVTVTNNDIERAAKRAETLSLATGLPTLPVVIGANIDQARHEFAAQRGVTLIAVAD